MLPATEMPGGIIQSETGAEEFVLLSKETATLAFSLYIPVQTQIHIKIQKILLFKYKYIPRQTQIQGNSCTNTTTGIFSL